MSEGAFIVGVVGVCALTAVYKLKNGKKLDVRKPVVNFARAMEETLKRNDWKGGWGYMNLRMLRIRLHQELDEFDRAYHREEHVQMRQEIVDVGNFCMMIWESLAKEGDDEP